jgi:DNA-binding NarL/FixJ family response regulator
MRRHRVQFVILDYRMPKMDGKAVAREIRRIDPHVPVIMLSGQINLPHAVLSAVDAFVSKGEPPAVLLQHLTALAEGGLGKHPLGTVTQAFVSFRHSSEVRRDRSLIQPIMPSLTAANHRTHPLQKFTFLDWLFARCSAKRCSYQRNNFSDSWNRELQKERMR